MRQRLYEVSDLPDGALAASSAFYRQHLTKATMLVEGADALTIVLAPAGHDQLDWRRALARDLAREYAPVRVNIIAATDQIKRLAMIKFLGDAPGLTGQYMQSS